MNYNSFELLDNMIFDKRIVYSNLYFVRSISQVKFAFQEECDALKSVLAAAICAFLRRPRTTRPIRNDRTPSVEPTFGGIKSYGSQRSCSLVDLFR